MKQKLNGMAPATEQVEIPVSFDENTRQELQYLVKNTADALTSLQMEIQHDYRVKVEWREYTSKRNLQWKQEHQEEEKKQNTGKYEIENVEEEPTEENLNANEQRDTTPANEIFASTLMDRVLSLVVKIVEHIREIKNEFYYFGEIFAANLIAKPAGMFYVQFEFDFSQFVNFLWF